MGWVIIFWIFIFSLAIVSAYKAGFYSGKLKMLHASERLFKVVNAPQTFEVAREFINEVDTISPTLKHFVESLKWGE